MELSQLTAYAQLKFHMREQRPWPDFPGFSVLADPVTGKWAALLMRQWDSDSGEEIQRCDMRCGQQVLAQRPAPFLSKPFRMKGPNWVGVTFHGGTEPETVFRLLDQAVSQSQRGYTIVLEQKPTSAAVVYADTPLSAPGKPFPSIGEEVPEKIYQMRGLYQCREGTFAEKCQNFYRQGKFMEDYEDDRPWNGDYTRYFPTYHDLNVRQLRGYFTWRAQVRRGEFTPIATSMAYIYVYELLNGIGAASPEDALEKLLAFQTGFVESGVGEASMGKNLRQWMLEFAVLHNLPPQTARSFASPQVLRRDEALVTLRSPQEATDQAVLEALCAFGPKKLEESPVVKKEGARGVHLFAEVWRQGLALSAQKGEDLFTACFGRLDSYPWSPLSNAVYWEEQPHPDADYALDPCRIYRCRGGHWQEERYENLYFGKDKLPGLLHQADRLLRKYLKTGHYLREKPEEAWAAPYVEAVLEAERAAALEAARPKITIDLSHLERIRRDAQATRESLLTDEERGENEPPPPPVEETPPPAPEQPDICAQVPGLEPGYVQLLLALLRGEPTAPLVQAHKWMPSVVADAINQAFFDDIGDNILECDGAAITLVEDYQEEILEMLGGMNP